MLAELELTSAGWPRDRARRASVVRERRPRRGHTGTSTRQDRSSQQERREKPVTE
jgi:hypothetical protein